MAAIPLCRWRRQEVCPEIFSLPVALGQLVVTLAKAGKAHREADAFFRCLENNEGRGLAVAELLDQLVVHDDFGNAAIRQAAHKAGAPDISLVNLEPQARRQQYAQWRNDT